MFLYSYKLGRTWATYSCGTKPLERNRCSHDFSNRGPHFPLRVQRDLIRVPYKVSIPLRKIKRVSPSENVKKPNKKYVQIVTVDDFEFWFMGFVSYRRSFKYLQQVIDESEMSS